MAKKKQNSSRVKSPSVSMPFKALTLMGWALFSSLSITSYKASASWESNWIGVLGWLVGKISFYTLGLNAFGIPIFLWWLGLSFLRTKQLSYLFKKSVFYFGMLCCSSFILSFLAIYNPNLTQSFTHFLVSKKHPLLNTIEPIALLGGEPFAVIYGGTSPYSFKNAIGAVGSLILFTSFGFIFLLFFLGMTNCLNTLRNAFNFFLTSIFFPKKIWDYIYKISKKSYLDVVKSSPQTTKIPSNNFSKSSFQKTTIRSSNLHKETIPTPPIETLSIFTSKEPQRSSNIFLKSHSSINKKFTNSTYAFPPADLLTKVSSESSFSKNDMKKQAMILKETLASFGIDVSLGNIASGPTLTSFEVTPSSGVKVQKIKALENDIALNMQAKSIRIIAPIPGKAAVGIEIPNHHAEEVNFRELLNLYRSDEHLHSVPLLLGKLSNGDPLWADLAKMPHLIIAGATGSGKSVCINSLVMSIIMNASPQEVRLVIVDPKKVELTAYSSLPHMLTPVITEANSTYSALLWLVKEMELRYEILRQLGLRNIHSFNTRKRNISFETALDLDIPEKMPYIVVIIDELADLFLSSSHDMETPIIRIAQMARAVGIHMVLATQRPSREVITGLIKANFPCRIAFKVSSRVNSQIIIDDPGAECLIGNGDMLFLPPGSANIVRAQGTFIRDDDINAVINYICSRYPSDYLVKSFEEVSFSKNTNLTDQKGEILFEQARSIIMETGNASTTFLQRKLKIGYARAAGLMDALEDAGIIGPSEGAKPRRILCTTPKERGLKD
ncbi:DNA translocase FtsK [Candidatus Clavichlamydia salmonicola]|nr:DNA translocase FtsK [Candidatus Clavichlamydia salmonicola]MBF5050524.1 DNA translocase FtsK [Candidatus Clavichlamydia salmonicola]